MLDLFSGIGGFSLGLERTGGFETVAFCEIDKHCHQVLKKHWPEAPIAEDIRELRFNREWDGHSEVVGNALIQGGEVIYKPEDAFGNIQILCGGFPCQDVSIAGNKKGITDETRSGLWFEYRRLIGEIRPSYVIIENVANLRNNGLVTVLQDLWTLGYDAEWNIISARDIGACHLRERLWIIAYSMRKGLEGSNVSSSSSTDREATFPNNGTTSIGTKTPDPDNIRFGKPFAPKEIKSQWWAEASVSQRDWWEAQPRVSGIYDGISSRSHEAHRKQRIKQLGNSIVPGIAEIIGMAILEYEK